MSQLGAFRGIQEKDEPAAGNTAAGKAGSVLFHLCS